MRTKNNIGSSNKDQDRWQMPSSLTSALPLVVNQKSPSRSARGRSCASKEEGLPVPVCVCVNVEQEGGRAVAGGNNTACTRNQKRLLRRPCVVAVCSLFTRSMKKRRRGAATSPPPPVLTEKRRVSDRRHQALCVYVCVPVVLCMHVRETKRAPEI